MITEYLEKFQKNFQQQIETRSSWDKNEVKEAFNSHYTRLLMNLLRATLHERHLNE